MNNYNNNELNNQNIVIKKFIININKKIINFNNYLHYFSYYF